MKKNNFNESISFKKEFEKENKNKILATSLINKELSINDLSDNQVNEMILYFEKYINNMNIKLKDMKEKIKKSLKKM